MPFDHPGVVCGERRSDGLIDRNRTDESQGHNLVRQTSSRLDQHGAPGGSRTRCLSITKRAHVHTCVRGVAESVGVEPTRLSLGRVRNGCRRQLSAWLSASVLPEGVEPSCPKTPGSEPGAYSVSARGACSLWCRTGSNRRRAALQTAALPTELPHRMRAPGRIRTSDLLGRSQLL